MKNNSNTKSLIEIGRLVTCINIAKSVMTKKQIKLFHKKVEEMENLLD